MNEQSLHLTSTIINNLPVGIFRTTLEGNIIFYNQTFAKILGFDAGDDLTKHRMAEFYENKSDRGNFIRLLIQHGTIHDHPLRLKGKNGQILQCLSSSTAVPDDDGMVVFLDGVLKISEKDIQQSQSAIDLNGLVNIITLKLDLQGNILEIDSAEGQFFGYANDQLVGQSLRDYTLPRYRQEFDLFINDILNSHRYDGILAIENSSGDIVYLEFQSSLVNDQSEKKFILSLARDITEKVNRQKEDMAKEKFQGIREMAGGIAHNINQPLTIINNILNEISTEMDKSNEFYPKIEIIEKQINKLNQITDKIRSVKKYRTVDYFLGDKIVDIDNIS